MLLIITDITHIMNSHSDLILPILQVSQIHSLIFKYNSLCTTASSS